MNRLDGHDLVRRAGEEQMPRVDGPVDGVSDAVVSLTARGTLTGARGRAFPFLAVCD